MRTRYDSYEEYAKKFNSDIEAPCVVFYNNERTLHNRSRSANWHENLEIQLCHSGEGYILINGEKYECTGNDILVANSNAVHYNGTDTVIRYTALIINTDFCRRAGIDPTALVFEPHIKSEALSRQFAEVIKAYYSEDGPCKMAGLQVALLELLIRLRREHTLSCIGNSGTGSSFERVKSAIRFIRKNYSRKLTLDEIAKNVLADKYNLSRSFKAFTGQTPVQYINNYRCERAKELIRGGTPISEAAMKCGFNNMSFFTKTFKQYTGKLPSEYKQK